jgi:type I restriction enzyme S subunit
MSDYPITWREENLSELSTLITKGATPTTYGHDYVHSLMEGGARFVRGNNATINGKFKGGDVKYICRTANEQLKRSKLNVGDVVISIVGSVGTSFQVDKKIVPANINQNVALIRPNDYISSNYLVQVIVSEIVQNIIATELTVQAQPSLSLKQVGDFKVPLPPLPEQQKIAKILTSVDEVIEKTQTQIDKLKDLKTGMMQALLIKGIGHTEFKDSPVGRIPVGWDAISIGHLLSSNIIASVQDGNHGEKHPKSADFVPVGIPFVMASDIHDQEIDIEGSNKITEEIYNGLRIGFSVAGDVLLSHKATVGLTAVVPENIKRIMLTPQVTYYRIADQSKLYNWYLHYCFQSGYFQERLSILSAQSTRSYIGIKAQADMLIALPSDLTEQQKIVDALKSLDSKIRLIKTKLNVLKDTKKALMQDLLTGKVRVNTSQATPKVTVD